MKIKLFILMLIGMPILAISLFLMTGSYRTHELKVFGKIPTFSLTGQTGHPVSLSDFRRKVWIASFIFTHCGEQCPRISEQMKRLQQKLKFKENLRLVTFTVDPKRDTAQALTRYATQFEANPNRWYFLTGQKKEVAQLVEQGFHLSSGGEDGMTHSSRLVLVDGFGRIRGYYDAMDDKAIATLVTDAKRLLREIY
jgi:protein SCO1